MKLALGTAQFGFDYGISNKRGKIPEQEVGTILSLAEKNKIYTLCTAFDYEAAEDVIGNHVFKNKKSIKIVTQFGDYDKSDIEPNLLISMKKLKCDHVYGYIIHHTNYFFQKPKIWNEFVRLKNEGKAKNIGFSCDYPSELEKLLELNLKFDIIQLPYNLLDQRFAKYFKILISKGIRIFVRSVFLQGLLLMNPSDISDYFDPIKKKIIILRKLSKIHDIPLSALCLQFADLNSNINNIMIGVDSLNNLKENIRSYRYRGKIKELMSDLQKLAEDDENMISPIKWKL